MQKNNKSSFSKFISSVTIVALLLVLVGPRLALAASVTSFSDTLSRQKASTLADHDISFITPTGIAASATLILTFDNSTSIAGALDFTDIDLLNNGTNVTLAAAPTGATLGVVRTSATVITFTNGSTAVTAGNTVRIRIGTNAVSQSTGVRQITNGGAGTTTLVLSGTFGDSGTAGMSIIADDQVVITATVAPTITFTVSDTTIGFGTLSSSVTTYANGATTGTTTGGTPAHNLTVATNATGGYIVSYNGATLTSGANTVDVASLTDSTGTPGTEAFGLSIATNGNATITSGYAYAGSPDWKWVASTTTTLITETGPTDTETFSMHYLANIAGSTQAGAYTTTTTYIATGTF